MRGVVVYESMYGNTHLVADAIAQGLALSGGVVVLPVDRVDPELLDWADLVVVGGPTHAHGMSRTSTRSAALQAAAKTGSALRTDPDAGLSGLREWFDSLGTVPVLAAAFDTRAQGPALLTGHAAKGIAKMLRRHGMTLIGELGSFLVDSGSRLVPGEETRAREWGQSLASELLAAAGPR